jgi:D-3-phosphoglycerate dehydrogenase
VTIEFEGHVAKENTKPLTATALTGLLGPLLESVNMVSAPVVARERGIGVKESHCDTCNEFLTLIRLTVESETQTRSVAGTLFNGVEPRLVNIKGIMMDAKLGPNMLFITNNDKPGLIGALGTTLGDAGVNIATFNLGRATPGGDAIALLEVDQVPDPAVLDALSSLPNIVRVKAMRF